MGRISGYEEALHRLLGLADFERTAGLAPHAFKYDLERMRLLAEGLGHAGAMAPAPNAPSPSANGTRGPVVVHVAGTKGKGSVSAMTASILRAAGLRVGLYTSPHLHSFRERIRLNGEPLSEDAFAAAVDAVWPVVEELAASDAGAPSTFEVLTAMAMEVFLREPVDAAVLEVGLGGRLDATNVYASDVAAITSLSLDHTAILGSTPEEIAWEKAGIVKRAQPVVSAPQGDGALGVIRRRCAELGAELAVVSPRPSEGREPERGEPLPPSPTEWERDSLALAQGWERGYPWGRGAVAYRVAELHGVEGQTVELATQAGTYRARLPLVGAHQAENAAVAVAAVERVPLAVGRDAIEAGLASVRWDGRFQTIERSPYVVVDGAHNPYSMERLGETVREALPDARVLAVFGASSDKQLARLAGELAGFAERVYTVASRHPRAARADELAGLVELAGGSAESVGDVARAIALALAHCGEEDVVLVTGSLFVVAEALECRLGVAGEHYPEFDPHAAAR